MSKTDQAPQLAAMRAANFDWTLHLRSVWSDSPFHVPALHVDLYQEISQQLDRLEKAPPGSDSPLGRVITGPGGAGKTHLLSVLRGETMRRGAAFILVDMTDVKDFWAAVLTGFTSSLQESNTGLYQHEVLLENLVGKLTNDDKVRDVLTKLTEANFTRLKQYVEQILRALSRRYRRETNEHQDVVRALIAANSRDFTISTMGFTWLQGLPLDDVDQQLGLVESQKRASAIVKGLSWVISLSAPAVVAFDQLDPIVRQLEYDANLADKSENALAEHTANTIVSNIGHGLSAMFDCTRRTQIVVSCLESSWDFLQHRVLASSTARFHPVLALKHLVDVTQCEELIAKRMQMASVESGFASPYPTWPFKPSAFAELRDVTPRELLRRCESHRRECIQRSEVIELDSFDAPLQCAPPTHVISETHELDQRFEKLQQEVDIAVLTDPQNGDEALAPVIQSVLRCLIKECSFPSDVDVRIDAEFTGGNTTKPLHGRIRLVFTNDQEREEHFCVRAIQRTAARAFQHRLKLAIDQSGIDATLSFRHLGILRSVPLPGGKVTGELLDQLRNNHGHLCTLGESELRKMLALATMESEGSTKFDSWLRKRQPASLLPAVQEFAGSIIQRYGVVEPLENIRAIVPGSSSPPPNASSSQDAKPSRPTAAAKVDEATESTSTSSKELSTSTLPAASVLREPRALDSSSFPLGYRTIGGQHHDVSMPMELLAKHAVVLAAAGSGKTVLLKRMVEEAALRGIPSLIIDAAGDMARLGDRVTTPPNGWRPSDHALAEQYHETVEAVVWTPGRESGNPIALDPLPDFAALDDPDDLDTAIGMATGAIAEMIGLKETATDRKKRGVLQCAVKYFAQQGMGSLPALIELLSELPAEARLGIEKEESLARGLSDQLRVLEETNPMLRSTGDSLDPNILFGDHHDDPRTRVSIISLHYLPSKDSQHTFVNQLAMTLFAWLKRNPTPPNRALRGLLIIDEAKDLAPSLRSTACKESLKVLAAQARKYRLGVIFATQNPRELDSHIIGNCSTQFFGKANSPAAQATIRSQMQNYGASGSDIGTLPKGTFYVCNADAGPDVKIPTKLSVPMCLTHHDTLDGDGIMERAVASRSQSISVDA